MKLATINDVFFNAVGRNLPRVMSYKSQGRWLDISSQELRRRVFRVARALRAWGLAPGDRMAILSENRPEWQIADFAALLLGVVDVPIYATLTAEQIVYMLSDSGARVIFVSTREQLQKLQSIGPQVPIEHIVVMDAVADLPANVVQFSAIADLTASPENDAADAALEAYARAIPLSQLATIIYTSGTTGRSKGVMLTHGNIASDLEHSLQFFSMSPADTSISYLPLSHITARHLDYACLQFGVTLAYLTHIEDLSQALLEVRPTILVAVPRVYEKVYNKVRQQSQGALKQFLYKWTLRVGQRHMSNSLSDRQPGSLSWKIANALLYSKVRQGFGGRVRAFISGGAPLGGDLAAWYAAIGIHIYEGYGLTETSPVVAINTPAANRLGTVGKVLPSVEAKIAADGELLVRGPSVFQGYWNQPQETSNAFADGWFKTGDVAAFDGDGFLTITDRKKDLIKTSGGKFIAPQPIEAVLKINPLVAQAAIIGDRRKFPAVVIAPQFPLLEEWAQKNGVAFASRQELIRQARVLSLYQEIVDAVNHPLAKYEKLKKFLLVPDEFSVATGELTPSMKLKRRVVEQKYSAQIEELYAEPAPLAVS